MLILPIVNRNRILNVEVKLKSANKIHTGVKFSDAVESDIIVNGQNFSKSIYNDEKSDIAVLNFIRNSSLRYKRKYLITTREESSSDLYDVYEVSQPPKRVNQALDNLYTSVITDMRKEIPGTKKGRYVSLQKLGVSEYLTDEKIEKLENIVKNVKDKSKWPILFDEAGILDLIDTLNFMEYFDCTVISDTTIPENNLQEIIDSLSKLNTRDSKNLSNYYNMALSNRDIYAKISYINKIIYDRPLTLIQSTKQKQKQLVKISKKESEATKIA